MPTKVRGRSTVSRWPEICSTLAARTKGCACERHAFPPRGVSKTALLSAYNKTSPCTILRLAPLCSENFLMAATQVNEKIEPRFLSCPITSG